ncbi:AraC family transcriptional regulator [Pseudoalteromonas piscicida]|uniref:HTH araC/xylS-type domain-containing protein n=1 Tax=Pseudoalteromonas piscicida TaxID=43662 RepID=A0ABN5CA00_PSEO7|nr:AraC family transcriptional regulator [Pseudoalteromonas piscicida]ATD06429.1 hypothetical protein PPIS_a1285 [Pseudoalteromonas piscicida]WPU33148.1 AraC family transcriptional regulator [Pseudoalteromonas piscicida]
MQKLIEITQAISKEKELLPFSIYRSSEEQHILNVPIIKPLLILILSGTKILGRENEINCPSGSFVFLSNTPKITMRNIPNNVTYYALLFEFDYSDFNFLSHRKPNLKTYFQGQIEKRLEQTIQQFVEWSTYSPPSLWYLRRQEMLQVLLSLGFDQVAGVIEPPTLSHKVYEIIRDQVSIDMSAKTLSSMLALSESTFRRKLSAEGNSLQAIKDSVKLGHGLHLIQTSYEPIGLIAEKCGYSSSSRFTDRFKQLYGLTPSALRKTRMSDSGE